MILRSRFEKEKPAPVKLPLMYIAVVGMLMAAALFTLAWCLRGIDQKESFNVAGSGVRQTGIHTQPALAPVDNVVQARMAASTVDRGAGIDSFKAGEEQAKRFYRKLEENPGISPEERSNIVNTIRLLESGQILIE